VKKLLNILYLLISISLFTFLLISSKQKRGNVLCNGLEIRVDTNDDLFFLNAEMVEELVFENDHSLVGKPIKDINIYLLEEFINIHPNIDQAELYLAIGGKLYINVKQRKPIARVFEKEQSYYLDSDISPMPLSENYSSRVLQVYWDEITAHRKEMLTILLDFIYQDEFLKAQITALEFDETDEVIMYPRAGNHKIILGKVENILEKLEKLKVFYRQGLEKVGWERYSHINLKFENQVVCTKR